MKMFTNMNWFWRGLWHGVVLVSVWVLTLLVALWAVITLTAALVAA